MTEPTNASELRCAACAAIVAVGALRCWKCHEKLTAADEVSPLPTPKTFPLEQRSSWAFFFAFGVTLAAALVIAFTTERGREIFSSSDFGVLILLSIPLGFVATILFAFRFKTVEMFPSTVMSVLMFLSFTLLLIPLVFWAGLIALLVACTWL